MHYFTITMMIMMFVSCKMFVHWKCRCFWCYFYSSMKLKLSFLISKEMVVATKYNVSNKFYNVIGVHLLKQTNMKQFHVQVCIDLFYF
jgi:hypothetical protein